jgi:hypothetical protein
MLRYLAVFVLAVSLLASNAVVTAQDHDQDHQMHQWSAQEDPHWHEYLKAHHKKDHEWNAATKREQAAYWKWRDAHPDAH